MRLGLRQESTEEVSAIAELQARRTAGDGTNIHKGAIMSTSINNLIGTFYEAASGKAELLGAVITDDWDDIPLGPGRAGARSLTEGLSKVFSDLRIVVEEIIDARGDDGNGMVGVRARMHGVHTGEFFGIAPTGRETEVRTHDFHQIVDGRIVRTHHMEDWVSWFQQVGSWPSN
jgi:predicted ester cyclase